LKNHSESLKKLQSAKVYYMPTARYRGGKSSGMGLLDRSGELVSESRLVTPVFGDRKLYDFVPAQKMEMGPPGLESPITNAHSI
jgi:hypothetical protein